MIANHRSHHSDASLRACRWLSFPLFSVQSASLIRAISPKGASFLYIGALRAYRSLPGKCCFFCRGAMYINSSITRSDHFPPTLRVLYLYTFLHVDNPALLLKLDLSTFLRHLQSITALIVTSSLPSGRALQRNGKPLQLTLMSHTSFTDNTDRKPT